MRNPGRIIGTRMGDGVSITANLRPRQQGWRRGHAELRRIITIGEDRKIVEDQPANRMNDSSFSGRSVSRRLSEFSSRICEMDIQRKSKTNLARAILDSAAKSINPKTS